MTPAAQTLVAMIGELEDNSYTAGRAAVRDSDSQRAAHARIRESRKRLFDFLKLITTEDLKSL